MKKIKVLVVDDDENNIFVCETNLKRLGYHVLSAHDGQEGLQLAVKELPDLILTDIMMPVMDGYELLEKLKQDPALSQIPVIMLTAKSDYEAKEIEKCFLAGADDFICKPYKLLDMTTRVQTHVKKHIALKAKEALEIEKKADLVEAARVQKKFLTNDKETENILKNAGLNSVFFNRPATDVSGDFWFPQIISPSKSGLFVADTCGHGVSAAIVSMRVLSIIDHCQPPILHPSEFLAGINQDIYGLLSQENSFVAGLYFIFNPQNFIFSNAGQPSPILIRGEEIIELKSSGSPLGMFPEVNGSEIKFDLKIGDRLFIYTDGLSEAVNNRGEPFGIERIIDFLQKNHSLPIENILDIVVSEVTTFTGENFDDDVTIIIIEKE
jgi:sigma-B regulation protein RsbU (phosphoserine phosphatase)